MGRQEVQQYTREMQLEALYKNVPSIVIFVALVSTAVGITLLFSFPAIPVLLWLGYMYANCLIRWFTLKHFKKEGYQTRGFSFWMNTFLLFSVTTGLGTGALVFNYFDPNNFVYTVFVLMTYTGFLSAGILSNSMYMPAFFAYSVPPTILVLISLFLHDDTTLWTLAVMVGFYYIALVGFARNANRTFKENVAWNQEKDSIVDQLREQKETAEQAIKAKSHFFASASHDLRQPLHALGLFHDALRYRIEKPENLALLDKISNSTQALNELLHGMLDISKLDASVVGNSPKDINLLESLRLVYSEFNERAFEKGLDLKFDLDPDVNIYVDPSLFERVVRNLVDNAIKYTDQGFVLLSAEVNDNQLFLKIKDSGIGIPDDQQENVFTEFNQLGNPERDKQKGLGLGLSIVRRLCNLMHVDIKLESQFGQGTTVLLRLPIGDKVDVFDIEKTQTLTQGNSNVLIIEDDEAILEGTALLLETFGFTVAKALTSEKALELSKQSRPNLIIADYRLPGEMDGIELIDEIRQHHEVYIPAILITGDTAPDRMKNVESADVVVLHKPVESEILENTINDALNSHLN